MNFSKKLMLEKKIRLDAVKKCIDPLTSSTDKLNLVFVAEERILEAELEILKDLTTPN
jgi:hypothetical protein